MLTSRVDQSWSMRVCLTARFAAHRLAKAMRAIAASYASLLQRASDDSPSFR
jgi:hypothetical protein